MFFLLFWLFWLFEIVGDQVEGMEVNANEGGVTHTRGGYQWFILPAGCV